MINKKVNGIEEALQGVKDQMTLMQDEYDFLSKNLREKECQFDLPRILGSPL